MRKEEIGTQSSDRRRAKPAHGRDLLEGADRFQQTTLPLKAEGVQVAGASGFEPEDCGLEVPSGFLTPTPRWCVRLAVALLVVLGLSGRLDAQTAYLLWQVFLP